MRFDPFKHHRRSIRLKGYDYSSNGMCFITICIQKRQCLLGEIIDNEMVLNDAAQMVSKWLHKIESNFADITIDRFVLMPNHVHFILVKFGDPRLNEGASTIENGCLSNIQAGTHPFEYDAHIDIKGAHILENGADRNTGRTRVRPYKRRPKRNILCRGRPTCLPS